MTYKQLLCLCAVLGILGCVEVEANEDIESNTSHNPPSNPAQTTSADQNTNEEEEPADLDLNNLLFVHEAIGSEEEPLDMCLWIGNPLDEGAKIIALTSVAFETPSCEEPGLYGSAAYADLDYEEVYNISSPTSPLSTGTLRRLNLNFQYKAPEPGDFMMVTFFNYEGVDIIDRYVFLYTDPSTYQRTPDSPLLPGTAAEFATSYNQHFIDFATSCPELAGHSYPSKEDIMLGFINDIGSCER